MIPERRVLRLLTALRISRTQHREGELRWSQVDYLSEGDRTESIETELTEVARFHRQSKGKNTAVQRQNP